MFGDSSGRCSSGRPVGTSPITGGPPSHNTPSSVPALSAASVGGRYLLNWAGQPTPTASVTTAMASALVLRSLSASGHSRIASSGPPVATGAPRNGRVCSRMMITPMPDMKPEMTE